MRIISGQYKGRSIPVTRNFSGRPTTDFAREGLFNILGGMIPLEGARVLDLFSGTGAISMECVSRGAAQVTAVEKSAVHASGIRKALEELALTGVQLTCQPAERFLSGPAQPFDLVFADPPFDLPWLEKLPDLVMHPGWVRPGGLFVLEHAGHADFTKHAAFVRDRNFGQVHFSFFRPLPA